jgi:hypothetical protein
MVSSCVPSKERVVITGIRLAGRYRMAAVMSSAQVRWRLSGLRERRLALQRRQRSPSMASRQTVPQ